MEPGRTVHCVPRRRDRHVGGPFRRSRPAAAIDAEQEQSVSIVLHARRKTAGVHGTGPQNLIRFVDGAPWERRTGLQAGKPEVFLQTPAEELYPILSPDGRWLAYSSNESGTAQIYVRAFPDKGGKWQISNSGGAYPMWSRSGHELFFESPDQRIMAASYAVKDDSFVADKPRLWSEKQIGGTVGYRNVDLAPDGKRIAAFMPAEAREAQQSQNHVTFLLNFFDELRRRGPVSK
jgi:WD40-like Beta Propeller Repeat